MSKRNQKPYFELTKVIIKYKKNALSGLSGFSIFHVDLTSWMIVANYICRKGKNLRNQRNIIRIKMISTNPIIYSIVAIKREENTALIVV